jgi:hypothetical protein
VIADSATEIAATQPNRVFTPRAYRFVVLLSRRDRSRYSQRCLPCTFTKSAYAKIIAASI